MTPVFAVVAKMMMMPMPPAPSSPVMQMDLHALFADHPMVQRMNREGKFDDSILAFLVDEAQPIEVRLAVASPMVLADPMASGDAFAKAAFKGVMLDKVKPTEKRADLLIIAGYLLTVRTGLPSMQARTLVDAAQRRAPTSFQVAMLGAMIRTQSLPNKPCDASRALMAPLRDPKLVNDASDKALFAYSGVAMQIQDMCKAMGGHG